MGLSIAKVFGEQGFQVALVSRSQDKLDALVHDLEQIGVDAAAFPADLMDRPTIVDAFAKIKHRFGAIEVLEYSPAPHSHVAGVEAAKALEVTMENVHAQMKFYVYGAITTTQQVLPEMLAAARGTLIYSTGGSSVNPRPWIANIGMAGAALRNWALCLRAALANKGVYATHVPIGVMIGDTPETEADVIAQAYWDIHINGEDAHHSYVWWDQDPEVESRAT